MIQLEVEKYCHECPAFTPVLGDDILMTWGMKVVNTPVVCKHKEACDVISDYWKKKLKVEAIFEE